MAKKKADGYFIQLGQRKNGRIVKNEQYTLSEMEGILENSLGWRITREPNWWDKLTRNKVWEEYYKMQTEGYLIDVMLATMVNLIEEDK